MTLDSDGGVGACHAVKEQVMRRSVVVCLLALSMVGLATFARADLIFFKDGFVLQGKIRREGTTEYDSGSRDFTFMPKGFYFVEDGARRIYFTPTQVAIVERLAAPTEERILRSGLDEMRVTINKKPPPIEDLNELKDWDYKKWERTFSYRSGNSVNVKFTQKIIAITPYYVHTHAVTGFRLSARYLTREFDPEVIRKLLLNHPHLQDDYMPPRPKLPPGLDKKDKDKGKDDKKDKAKD